MERKEMPRMRGHRKGSAVGMEAKRLDLPISLGQKRVRGSRVYINIQKKRLSGRDKGDPLSSGRGMGPCDGEQQAGDARALLTPYDLHSRFCGPCVRSHLVCRQEKEDGP